MIFFCLFLWSGLWKQKAMQKQMMYPMGLWAMHALGMLHRLAYPIPLHTSCIMPHVPYSMVHAPFPKPHTPCPMLWGVVFLLLPQCSWPLWPHPSNSPPQVFEGTVCCCRFLISERWKLFLWMIFSRTNADENNIFRFTNRQLMEVPPGGVCWPCDPWLVQALFLSLCRFWCVWTHFGSCSIVNYSSRLFMISPNIAALICSNLNSINICRGNVLLICVSIFVTWDCILFESSNSFIFFGYIRIVSSRCFDLILILWHLVVKGICYIFEGRKIPCPIYAWADTLCTKDNVINWIYGFHVCNRRVPSSPLALDHTALSH